MMSGTNMAGYTPMSHIADKEFDADGEAAVDTDEGCTLDFDSSSSPFNEECHRPRSEPGSLRILPRITGPSMRALPATFLILGCYALWKYGSHSQSSEVREIGNDELEAFDTNAVNQKMETATNVRSVVGDPFNFHCLLRNKEGQVATKECCKTFDRLWPYQYPTCPRNCDDCWKKSDNPSSIPHVEKVGLAWAAATMAYNAEPLHEKRFQRGMFTGLRARMMNVCPNIDDWIVDKMVNEELHIEVRIYKSKSHRLAVIAFRGTDPSSTTNWLTDVEINPTKLTLPDGKIAMVHGAYLGVVDEIKHTIRTWSRKVPPKEVSKWVKGLKSTSAKAWLKSWTVVFTGHSMGGALAQLTAMVAAVEGWERQPDVITSFGAPRWADETAAAWWQKKGLCDRSLRVNVYNDVVHWLPFSDMWTGWKEFSSCLSNVHLCFQTQQVMANKSSAKAKLSDRWSHVCPQNELVVPGAVRGVNPKLEDTNPFGGALAHFTDNCLFGYGFGVLHSTADLDRHCGLQAGICPSRACEVLEDLSFTQCKGLHKDPEAADEKECRAHCCNDPQCNTWQWDTHCWRGLRTAAHCSVTKRAKRIIFGEHIA